MTSVKRGGPTFKGGKIGRVNCIRQQIMMPGERMNVSINGQVRLESLRERESFRIHAHLAAFMTPIRWLWPEFTDYLKQGPDTAITPPIYEWNRLSDFGIGSFNDSLTRPRMFQFYRDNVHRVYNEWYKHPEDPDVDPATTNWNADGEKAVPLSKPWSRCRYKITPDDAADYTVDSGTSFDVRELARKQARFRSAMKREVFSYGRWMETVNEMYNGADPSREVDQVPIMLDQTEIGVNPRDLPATDAAGLGQWQTLFDFNINHQIRGIVAPEHCLISYFLVVRFASITDGIHPLATDRNDWYTLCADPEFLASQQPVPVQVRDVQMDGSNTTQLGYLPAGWQWRSESDCIGYRIDLLDTFPYMQPPTTQANAKDASRIKNAFRSDRLGNYVVDVYFNEDSKQPGMGTAMDSYLSGMVDEARNTGNSGSEFPKGGKSL